MANANGEEYDKWEAELHAAIQENNKVYHENRGLNGERRKQLMERYAKKQNQESPPSYSEYNEQRYHNIRERENINKALAKSMITLDTNKLVRQKVETNAAIVAARENRERQQKEYGMQAMRAMGPEIRASKQR